LDSTTSLSGEIVELDDRKIVDGGYKLQNKCNRVIDNPKKREGKRKQTCEAFDLEENIEEDNPRWPLVCDPHAGQVMSSGIRKLGAWRSHWRSRVTELSRTPAAARRRWGCERNQSGANNLVLKKVT